MDGTSFADVFDGAAGRAQFAFSQFAKKNVTVGRRRSPAAGRSTRCAPSVEVMGLSAGDDRWRYARSGPRDARHCGRRAARPSSIELYDHKGDFGVRARRRGARASPASRPRGDEEGAEGAAVVGGGALGGATDISRVEIKISMQPVRRPPPSAAVAARRRALRRLEGDAEGGAGPPGRRRRRPRAARTAIGRAWRSASPIASRTSSRAPSAAPPAASHRGRRCRCGCRSPLMPRAAATSGSRRCARLPQHERVVDVDRTIVVRVPHRRSQRSTRRAGRHWPGWHRGPAAGATVVCRQRRPPAGDRPPSTRTLPCRPPPPSSAKPYDASSSAFSFSP